MVAVQLDNHSFKVTALPMSKTDCEEMITVFKGEVRIDSHYIKISEIWIPPPYSLAVNLGSTHITGQLVNVYSADKPRFSHYREIPISRALADQYLRYANDKKELRTATELIFGAEKTVESDSDSEI